MAHAKWMASAALRRAGDAPVPVSPLDAHRNAARRRDPRRTGRGDSDDRPDRGSNARHGPHRGPPSPDEDVVPLTLRLNALLEASEALDHSRWRTSWLSHTLTPLNCRSISATLEGAAAGDGNGRPLGLQAHHRIGAFDTDATPVAGGTDRPVSGTHRSVQRRVEVVYHGRARERAARGPRGRARPDAGVGLGPLHGIPLAYKDEFYTKGARTTCGSVILSAFVPTMTRPPSPNCMRRGPSCWAS